jgi:hypothetical protein
MEFVKVPEETRVNTSSKDMEVASGIWRYIVSTAVLTFLVFLVWIWLHGSYYYAGLRRIRFWLVDIVRDLTPRPVKKALKRMYREKKQERQSPV